MKIKMILIVLNVFGLLGALIWLLTKPDWESFVTCIGLIATLITQLNTSKENNNDTTIMKQKGGKASDVSESQNAIAVRLAEQGYKFVVCFGANHAIDEIKKYLFGGV